ncbi:hypothetical protein [Streptomyces sp. NPDC089919]|uniref:hypothetical protein n=1 Tax=Streptomyces sp. NPDC089919 TaxID=3155188 RepID=UPI003443307A
MRSRLVFVHGIGGPRDPATDLAAWTRALASGMRAAGHGQAADELEGTASGEHPDQRRSVRFAHYADLFGAAQAQGGEHGRTDGAEAEALSELLVAWVAELAAVHTDDRDLAVLAHARAEAAPRAQEQGVLEVVRRALNVATTVLALKPWGAAAGWVTPKVLVGQLRQVARYLARAEADADGTCLDRRIRARVAEAVGAGPAVVVAHSLGTVVALEALHELEAQVPLFVTLGSPIGMRTLVWPRLRPQPPGVPAAVGGWLNFWDRDDVIAVRPCFERELRPGPGGIVPVSRRVDSDGVWVHSAEKYLAQPGVAGPVAQALGLADGTAHTPDGAGPRSPGPGSTADRG